MMNHLLHVSNKKKKKEAEGNKAVTAQAQGERGTAINSSGEIAQDDQ